MNQQGFEDDQQLQFLQMASLIQRRRAILVAVLSALTVLFITAGLSIVLYSFDFLRIAVVLGIVALLATVIIAFRTFHNRSSETQEIAQRADAHWQTTGRFAALWEVYTKPSLLQRKEKFDLISSQLSSVGRNFSVKELLRDTPLLYPVLSTLCALLFFLVALLFRPAQTPTPSQLRRAEMKEELSTLLESAPAMPRIIEKKLESLQASLEDSTLSDEEVIGQIDELLSDVSAASELYRELEQSRTEQSSIVQDSTTPEQEPVREQDDSQTPPEEPEEKPERQEDSSSHNSQSGEGKGEDGEKDSQGAEGKEGQEGSSPNESQEQQESGEGDSQQSESNGADGGKQGSGEEQGAQGEESSGNSQSGAGNGDSDDSAISSGEGESDSGEMSSEAQGEESKGGETSESSSDSPSSEQSSGAQSSDTSQSSTQAQSLEQATQVLEGMKEQLQVENDQNEARDEAGDKQADDNQLGDKEEGEGTQQGERENSDGGDEKGANENLNNMGEQGDSPSSDSQEQSSENAEETSGTEDGSRPEQQLGEQTDDNVAQGASVGEGEPIRREVEGEGDDGFQEGSFGFEDKQIGSLTEKVDAQYAEGTGKFSRNEGAASSLREIQKVDLAPPTVRDRPQQQRIPPEYRDILRQR